MKLLMPLLLSATIQAKPIFDMHPVEGQILVVACDDHDDSEECAYEAYPIKETPLMDLSKKRFPGLDKAPAFIVKTISNVAESMGDATYIHVGVKHKDTTYEYMFDRSSQWNSFRSIEAKKPTIKN